MGSTGWSDTLRLESSSGHIRVTLPSTASTEVVASSRTGSVKSDFPLAGSPRSWRDRIRLRGSLGQEASGVVGAGGRTLLATSTAGRVVIERGP